MRQGTSKLEDDSNNVGQTRKPGNQTAQVPYFRRSLRRALLFLQTTPESVEDLLGCGDPWGNLGTLYTFGVCQMLMLWQDKSSPRW